MEEDILTLMEALTIQASDTDPDPVAVASEGVEPPIKTPPPLEDDLSTAQGRVNVGQKTVQQNKTEETREMFSFSPCQSAAVPGLCTDVAPEVLSDTNVGGNGGKKGSRKRRNRKKSKTVYLSWPVTIETGASSASPFPCQASVMGASCSKEQRRKGEEKAVVHARFQQEPASALLPEAGPVQAPLEGFSVAARKERKAQKRHQYKKRPRRNQKMESSPWPVTVQAWASFVSPEPVQTSFIEYSPTAYDGIKDDVFVLPLCQGTHADILGSYAPLGQASWEEMVPDVNTKRKMEKIQKRWQGKKDDDLDHTWPQNIQGWAPFPAAAATAAEPVQTLSEAMSLQWECWPPLENEKERKCFIPWSEDAGAGSFFSAIAPLKISWEAPAMKIGQSKPDKDKRSSNTLEEQFQGSEMLALESYQNWGNTTKYSGDQDGDNWEYSILDLPTQAECYCPDPFSEEGGKAPTLVGSDAYDVFSEAERGRQEAEEDKATFQTLWMGKWGGF